MDDMTVRRSAGVHPMVVYRHALGLKQSEVAERAGISREQFSKLESGKAKPMLATALKIAAALGQPPEALFPQERNR